MPASSSGKNPRGNGDHKLCLAGRCERTAERRRQRDDEYALGLRILQPGGLARCGGGFFRLPVPGDGRQR